MACITTLPFRTCPLNCFPPEKHHSHWHRCQETTLVSYCDFPFSLLLLTSLLDMSLVKSSLYKAIVLLLAFTLAVQKTAAQAVLCGQYQNFTSTSGLYESKSKVRTSHTTGHNLTRIRSTKRRLGCRRFGIAVHNGIICQAQVLSRGTSKIS